MNSNHYKYDLEGAITLFVLGRKEPYELANNIMENLCTSAGGDRNKLIKAIKDCAVGIIRVEQENPATVEKWEMSWLWLKEDLMDAVKELTAGELPVLYQFEDADENTTTYFDSEQELVEEHLDDDDYVDEQGVPKMRIIPFRGRSHKFSEYADPENILETAADYASDDCHLVEEDYLQNVSKEAKEDLARVLDAWADKHGLQPTFQTLTRLEERPMPVDKNLIDTIARICGHTSLIGKREKDDLCAGRDTLLTFQRGDYPMEVCLIGRLGHILRYMFDCVIKDIARNEADGALYVSVGPIGGKQKETS